MNKKEFLAALEARLSGLPENDIKKSVEYYAEIIDDATDDGVDENEAVANLGSVDGIAEQILGETPLPKLVKNKLTPKRRLFAWEIVLLILGSPIWLSLLITAVACVIAVYASLWSVIIALYAAVGVFFGGVAGGIIGGIAYFMTEKIAEGLFFIGCGLICGGIAVLLLFSINGVTMGILKLSKRFLVFIKSRFVRKESET